MTWVAASYFVFPNSFCTRQGTSGVVEAHRWPFRATVATAVTAATPGLASRFYFATASFTAPNTTLATTADTAATGAT